MPRTSTRPQLILTSDEKKDLDELSRRSRTAAVRDVQRAQILLRYHAGETVSQIGRALKTTRKSVLKWIDKALQMGVKAGMKDTPHKPREAVIDPRWPGMCAGRRQRQVFRHSPGQVRRPSSEFSRRRSYSPIRSGTTWSAAIRNSSGRCGKSCWSIAKWLCRTKLPARAVRHRM